MEHPDVEELKLQLLKFHSPFSWDLPQEDPTKVDQFLINQLEKLEQIEEENSFKWIRYILHLVLAFELWSKLGDIVSALGQINSCCQELIELKENGCSEPFFLSIEGALWHITMTTKAHLLLANSQLLDAKVTLMEIPINLSNSERAALWGIKAAVFKQYKPKGTEMALGMAATAITIDPYQAEWFFLRASCFGRMRRMDSSIVNKVELQEMEHAYRLQQNATYTTHLAQVYADHSHHLYLKRFNHTVCCSSSDILQKSRHYSKAAIKLYRRALALRPHCPLMKVRIAHGMLRIRDPMITDVDFAKQLLDEANVHIPSSSMLHHDLGRYYDKFAHDPIRAIQSLWRAHELNNYKAFLYLIRLVWQHCHKTEVVSLIKSALDQYKTDENNAELLVYLGTCHLLLYNDWITAVKYFTSSLQLDPNAKYFKMFNGIIWKGKINFLGIIINELHQIIKEEKSKTTIFHDFLQRISSIGQNFVSKPEVLYSEFKKKQMQTAF